VREPVRDVARDAELSRERERYVSRVGAAIPQLSNAFTKGHFVCRFVAPPFQDDHDLTARGR
jgi:hypothetical protein